MGRLSGCVWTVAAIMASGVAVVTAWAFRHVQLSPGAALLILAGLGCLFFLAVGIMARHQRRNREQEAAEFRRWLIWRNGKPNPGGPEYNDWYQDGAARFNRAMERYIRENGPEPGTEGNNGR